MASRPAIPPHAARLEALRERLRASGIDGLLVGPGAELRYLAGYEALALERLTLLVVPTGGEAVLIVPRLELEPAERSPAGQAGLATVRAWEETDDPFRLVAEALGRATPRPGRLLVGDRLWAMFVLRLQETFPGARFALASSALRALRMRKDPEEIALLRAAAHAADRVMAAIAAGTLVGRSERAVAHEIGARLVAEGHDEADIAIVASGPNSASPHHAASDRVIEAGEPLVLDFGGTLDGYASDMTRTFWVAGPAALPADREFVRLYRVVRDAYSAAVQAVRPGVSCAAVDRAARDRISQAGYGPSFLHRTGHGIGLEVHEDPYIVAGNSEPLEPRMAFSIEPGIYLEGRYGARLEDIVVCSESGADILNEAPRDLYIVAG